MERLKGTIVETIFRNNENGYTVALLETNRLITITGVFGTDISGENIEVFGKEFTIQNMVSNFKLTYIIPYFPPAWSK